MSKSDEFLMNDVSGEELGLDEDDEVPLMEGVLRGALGAWGDKFSWVRSMRFVCGDVRVSLGLLLKRDNEVEGEPIVGDEE